MGSVIIANAVTLYWYTLYIVTKKMKTCSHLYQKEASEKFSFICNSTAIGIYITVPDLC
jgi:hypothetical protein